MEFEEQPPVMLLDYQKVKHLILNVYVVMLVIGRQSTIVEMSQAKREHELQRG